ncbi:DUF4261 domain-containing protein [Corynebacterium sp.]|uniref:DUF4261 domain-containing protein n=1 Tax=Corynebacterium sp. TaxID=1720 RepID=UPI0026DB9B0A|nr:DUF4261 domain-containing protein [Corynebacterium sp.]MDO5077152.1 DUF4261 domain-containing protein [Corynebacterium sp.]
MAIAILLQNTIDEEVTQDALREQLHKDWPELAQQHQLADDPEFTGDQQPGMAAFTYRDSGFLVKPIPVPFGQEPIEKRAASSLWPNGADFNEQYQAHSLVMVANSESLSGVQKAELLSKVVASLVAISRETFAVVWPASDQLIMPEVFRNVACSMLPDPLLPIWLNFSFGTQSSGNFAAATVGLDRMDLMDLEMPESTKTPGETLDFLAGVADYLIRNGLVIKDGDTVGQEEGERIIVRFAPSMIQEGKMVIQLQEHQNSPERASGS